MSYNWDIEQVKVVTKEIMKQLKYIETESERLLQVNVKYRVELKDQVSEDVNKCIIKIRDDAQQMQDDIEKRNNLISESNSVLYKIENEDRIKA